LWICSLFNLMLLYEPAWEQKNSTCTCLRLIRMLYSPRLQLFALTLFAFSSILQWF
jgi:hypothetical protein